jgi:molybdopterin-binding protein
MELTRSLLGAEGLRQRYGSRVVVDIDRLTVGTGEVLAILGPNGAGKSTLFRLLLLLERAETGYITLSGKTVRKGDRSAMRRLAGVFQKPHLFDGTVADNVSFGLRARRVSRKERRERVATALSWFGLEARARSHIRSLSGGEAQRVALARALVLEPEVLLLDEPTANLDVTVQRRFREDLERVARERTRGVILITHNPVDAFALADRIVLMEDGRIVQTGTPEELVLRPATPFAAAFTGAELLLDGVVTAVEDGLLAVRLAAGTVVWAAGKPSEAWPLRTGDLVHVAYRPEDIVVAPTAASTQTSAINRFDVTIRSMHQSDALVRVRLIGSIDLTALVTRRSADALGLAPGVRVEAHLKATAARAFAAAARSAEGS